MLRTFISDACPCFLTQNTCRQRFPILPCANKTTIKSILLHAVLLYYLYFWLECLQMKGFSGREKKNSYSYNPQCTLWWTLHKSNLCSAGGDSLAVKCETKQISRGTGSLWWWNALLIETTECRETRWIMTWWKTHSVTKKPGRLAEGHLATIHVKRQTRTHAKKTAHINTSALHA